MNAIDVVNVAAIVGVNMVVEDALENPGAGAFAVARIVRWRDDAHSSHHCGGGGGSRSAAGCDGGDPARHVTEIATGRTSGVLIDSWIDEVNVGADQAS